MVIAMSTEWLPIIQPGLCGTELGRMYEECWEDYLDDFKYHLCKTAEDVMDEILKEDCIINNIRETYTYDVSFHSPRDYMWENDSLEFDMAIDPKAILSYWQTFDEEDRKTFFKWIKQHYGSYSGFISEMPYESEEFTEAIESMSDSYSTGKRGYKYEKAVAMLIMYTLVIKDIDLESYQRDLEEKMNEICYDNEWYEEFHEEEEEE